MFQMSARTHGVGARVRRKDRLHLRLLLGDRRGLSGLESNFRLGGRQELSDPASEERPRLQPVPPEAAQEPGDQ